GRRGQRLEGIVPALLVDLLLQPIALQILVVLDEAVGFHDLERIGRSRQHVGEQRVGIERNRRDQRFELFRFQQGLVRLGWRRRRRRRGLLCGRPRSAREQHRQRQQQRFTTQHGYSPSTRSTQPTP